MKMMLKKGWMLYNKDEIENNLFFSNQIIEYGKKVGLEIQVVALEELILGVNNQGLTLDRIGYDVEIPDFVMNRTRNAFIAHHLHSMGITLYNRYEVTYLCNHKGLTHQKINSLGIPSTRSIFFNKSFMSLESCKVVYPLIIKSYRGHGGREVYWAKDLEDAKKYIERCEDEEVLLQEPSERLGIDIRVYILGGKIFQVVRRTSNTDFRSNFSLGGSVEAYDLKPEEKEMIQVISNALALDYAGIDFIVNEENALIFNEIEDVVGSRMLYSLGEVDPAKAYVDYIRAQENKKQKTV